MCQGIPDCSLLFRLQYTVSTSEDNLFALNKHVNGTTLGTVCHIVHLSVNSRCLLGHQGCRLVPFGRSEAWRRQQYAQMSSAIHPGNPQWEAWGAQQRDVFFFVKGAGGWCFSCTFSMPTNTADFEPTLSEALADGAAWCDSSSPPAPNP